MRLSAVLCCLFVIGLIPVCRASSPASEAGAEKKTTRVVTKEMVWNADRQVVHIARQRWADLDGRRADECFADAMKDLGSSVYLSIKKSIPEVALWPAARSSKHPTLTEPLPEGGYAIVLPYTFRNTCHTCEIIGTAYSAFDFDREGWLTGIRLVKTEQPPKKTVVKADNRRESEQIRFIVMTEEGKEFTVRLESNRTTGYQWRPAEPLDERVIRLSRSEYAPFDTGMTGAGGEESWTFLAVGKGDTEVVMEYVRPWEKGQSPLKTATIKVSVKPVNQK